MKLEEVLLQGLASARPIATAVATGSLYFSTDTEVLEQSDGAVWSPYSAISGGSSDWDTIVVKSVDQDVTNSTVLVDDTELQLAVLANEGWLIELIIAYSGSDINRDFKWDIAVSAGTMSGSGIWVGFSTSDVIFSSAAIVSAAADTTDQSMGTLAAQEIRMFRTEWTLIFTTNGTFTFRFAQVAAGVGLNSRCEAGSILRAKQIL